MYVCTITKKREREREEDIYNQYYPTIGEKKKEVENNSKRICSLIYASANIFGRDDNDRHYNKKKTGFPTSIYKRNSILICA